MPTLSATFFAAACFIAALVPTSALAQRTIRVAPRTPAVMALVLPKDTASETRAVEFIDAAATVIDRKTSLELLSLERAGLDGDRIAACNPRTRLSCMVDEVRAFRVLFVLTVLPFEEGRDRLNITMIDIERALGCWDESDGDSDNHAANIEGCIHDRASMSEPVMIETADPKALTAYFESVVGREFRPALESLSLIEPFGRIALATDEAGDEIALDGAAIGKTSTAVMHLEDVAAGRHSLRLLPVNKPPIEMVVLVKRGKTSSISAQLYAEPEPVPDPGRTTLFITGASAAAAGLAFAAVSIAVSGSVKTRCFVSAANPNASCTALGDPTIGFRTATLPTSDRGAINPVGIPILPLAFALFAAGVTWAGIAYFGDRTESVGVIEIGLGAIAGAGVFAIGALTDPRR